MIGLSLPTGHLSVLSIGAHCDDIEIGCGALLLTLAARGDVTFHNLILTGSPTRADEARVAAKLFLGDACAGVEVVGLPDGRLPAHWTAVKDALETSATSTSPDLILVPRPDDAHQDHRLLGELVTTVWRNSLVLHYEIPKWDGDLRPVTHYVGLSAEVAQHKVELLHQAFPSQHSRDWWVSDTFLALMRLRGMECRAPYAEGFIANKVLLTP